MTSTEPILPRRIDITRIGDNKRVVYDTLTGETTIEDNLVQLEFDFKEEPK